MLGTFPSRLGIAPSMLGTAPSMLGTTPATPSIALIMPGARGGGRPEQAKQEHRRVKARLCLPLCLGRPYPLPPPKGSPAPTLPRKMRRIPLVAQRAQPFEPVCLFRVHYGPKPRPELPTRHAVDMSPHLSWSNGVSPAQTVLEGVPEPLARGCLSVAVLCGLPLAFSPFRYCMADRRTPLPSRTKPCTGQNGIQPVLPPTNHTHSGAQTSKPPPPPLQHHARDGVLTRDVILWGLEAQVLHFLVGA